MFIRHTLYVFAELSRIFKDFIGGSFDSGEVSIEFIKVLIGGTWYCKTV